MCTSGALCCWGGPCSGRALLRSGREGRGRRGWGSCDRSGRLDSTKLEETGEKLLDLVAGERLPGVGGHVGETVEEAAYGGLCHSSAGVELRRELVEETAEEPCLP